MVLSPPRAQPSAAPMSPARLRAAFTVLPLGMLLAMLDSTVVGTAMPTIVS